MPSGALPLLIALSFSVLSLAPALAETGGAPGPAAIAPGGHSAPVEKLFELRAKSWQELVDSRVVRVLLVYNRTHFFIDGAQQRGITADALRELEKHLNRELGLGARQLHLVPIPVRRDQLLPYLESGRGDIAAANLTITPEREARVDFTIPISSAIDEVIVTGPSAPSLRGLDDLSGQRVHLRRSSSFWPKLAALSQTLQTRGLPPIELVATHEYLETEDLLEMASAGVYPITVSDSHMATFWADVLPKLVVREDLKLAEGTRIAWALRKDVSGLKVAIDPWIRANRQGQLLGNILQKRYLRDNRWVRGGADPEEDERLLAIFEHFRHYGDRYAFDWRLLAAQGYQESGLDQRKRSPAGAVGIMQLLPSTARDDSVGIPNIEELEPNIHAGTRYLRHLVDTYLDSPELDEANRHLFAFASYNAGPSRIRRLRREAAKQGLDPNLWFGNVEIVAARDIGRETVQYVANIYKYYVTFDLLFAQMRARDAIRDTIH